MAKRVRLIGMVVAVYHAKGYFFICGPDDRDYFAWVGDIPDHRSLNTLIPQVTRIEFTPVEPEPIKGPAARDLIILDTEHQPEEDPTARRLGLERTK